MPILFVRHQHHVDGVGERYAGRAAVVAERLVPDRADRLIEGGRPGDIADRQADEDHFGHEGLLFAGSVPKDERREAIPTWFFELFLVRHSAPGASRGRAFRATGSPRPEQSLRGHIATAAGI